MSRFIAENWGEITSVFRLSAFSGARPKFPALADDGRAIRTASLASKRQSQRHLASAFPVILSLDINRFYGSIYTHSIPWAVLGKHEAKRRHHNRTLNRHWSDRLDTLVRNCNQRQTVGIPIGPDTSRIISELILSRVDAEVTSAGSGLTSLQIHHNIDDYQIGCIGISEAENAQSCFVRAISRYELRLNDFKTSFDHGLSFTPSNFQRHFDFLDDQQGSLFVEHFFEVLYAQIPQHQYTNVVGYALKRFARRLARNSEKDLVREYLQRLLFAAPHQARWILPLLLGLYRTRGVNAEVRRIIAWGVEVSVRRNDVGSLLWYLYAAIFVNMRLTGALGNQCLGMSNELVDLMLYHGRSQRLFSFDVRQLRTRYRDNGLSSSSWLPIYEIGRRGWDNSTSFAKIGTIDDPDNLYQHLRDQGVEFYLSGPDQFEVEAFADWRLTTRDFEMEEDDWVFGLEGQRFFNEDDDAEYE
ncbi:MAG: RNA-directed DNA polymerase [Roseovarius sp.]